MWNRGINKISKFKSEATPLQPQFLVSNIEPADSKVAARIEADKHISHSKKKKEVSAEEARKIKQIVGRDFNYDNTDLKVRTTQKVSPNKVHISKNADLGIKHSKLSRNIKKK